MTRDEHIDGLWAAFRLGAAGLTPNEFADALQLGEDCRTHKREYERESADEPRHAQRAGQAVEHARQIADRNGWHLDTGVGLWWELTIPKAENRPPGWHWGRLAALCYA